MKKFGVGTNSILMSIMEAVIGTLLLINPISFTSGIIIVCGIVLALAGLYSVIRYFREEPDVAAIGQQLSIGLVLIVFGLFCTFNSTWFIATFPLLTMIYGVFILITGFCKIQWSVDMVRMKKKNWILPAISAAISIICAIIVIGNPFTTTEVLWIFTGVSLIAEAVFDLVSLIMSGTKMGESEEENEEE